MHLGQVASTLDLPIEVLRQLNPQYRLDIIPATGKHYTLVLPQSMPAATSPARRRSSAKIRSI